MDSVIRIGISVFLGTIIALYLPSAITKLADYKMDQSQKPRVVIRLSITTRICLTVLHVLLYVAAFFYIPLPQAILVAFFITIACIAAIIDFYLRIIPNEIVLILLASGILYRILDGGFASLLGSLIALLLTIVLFAAAAGITFIRKHTIGVGAGDIKLAMVLSIALGFPGVVYFFLGLGVAVIAYLLISLKGGFLIKDSYFPMAAPILVGFLFAVFWPVIEQLSVLL